MKIFRKEPSKSLGGLAPVIPLRSYVLPSRLLIYIIAKDGGQNTYFVYECNTDFRVTLHTRVQNLRKVRLIFCDVQDYYVARFIRQTQIAGRCVFYPTDPNYILQKYVHVL